MDEWAFEGNENHEGMDFILRVFLKDRVWMCSFYQRLASWKKAIVDRLGLYPLFSLSLSFFYLFVASTLIICGSFNLLQQRLLKCYLAFFHSILIDISNTPLMIEAHLLELSLFLDVKLIALVLTIPLRFISSFYWLSRSTAFSFFLQLCWSIFYLSVYNWSESAARKSWSVVDAFVIQFNGSTFTCVAHWFHSFSSCCKTIAVTEIAIGILKGKLGCDFYVEQYQIFSLDCDRNLSIMIMSRSGWGFHVHFQMIWGLGSLYFFLTFLEFFVKDFELLDFNGW